jgi:hypothetical protein
MALTLKERLRKRLAGLQTARQAFEPEWREIAQHCQPSRARFLTSDTNKRTGRSNRAIYNAHGILSARTLTGGMTSGLSSPSRPWFRLAPFDEDLADDQEVKEYLAEVERRMYTFLAGTNFYAAVKAGYGELGLFGTEACVMVEHWREGAVCHALTVGEYWIGLSDAAVPDTLYRTVPMTVGQVVPMFEGRVHPNVRLAYDQSNYDRAVDVYHAVEPNRDFLPGRKDARGKLWRSVWWDAGDDRVDSILRDEGFNEQPFWAPRWDTTGGDVYGSSPGMDALPDLRELQLQTKRKTQATAFMVKPEKIVPATVKLTGEAGNTVTASTVDAAKVAVPYEMPYQAIQAIMADMERCTNSVDRLFYADLFMAITNMQGVQPRNIEEIASRNEEKLTQLGPVIERVNNEKLEVAIDRTFGIMQRASLLPDPPEHMQGRPIKVDFVSILAQMQRMVGIGQIERTAGFIGNLAGVFPEAADKLNIDEMIDEYADRAGAPPKIIRSNDAVKSIRDARIQQKQMEQAAMAAPAMKDGAAAAELLSRTRTEPGTALDALTGGAMA